jgi:ABC-type molybdenum transport system ATPase subunit/photorepair protein PhrA
MGIAMNVQAPAIEFRDVSLSFGDQFVLKDVSFTLQPGEMILVTGVSGSGKSGGYVFAVENRASQDAESLREEISPSTPGPTSSITSQRCKVY